MKKILLTLGIVISAGSYSNVVWQIHGSGHLNDTPITLLIFAMTFLCVVILRFATAAGNTNLRNSDLKYLMMFVHSIGIAVLSYFNCHNTATLIITDSCYIFASIVLEFIIRSIEVPPRSIEVPPPQA